MNYKKIYNIRVLIFWCVFNTFRLKKIMSYYTKKKNTPGDVFFL